MSLRAGLENFRKINTDLDTKRDPLKLTSDLSGQGLLTKRQALIDYHRNANYLVFTKRTAVRNTGFEETLTKERLFDKVMGNSRLL